jgi:hypothetical protein
MKWLSIAFIILFFAVRSNSQQIADLEENIPYSYKGLEYGYYISNESSKEVKGEDYLYVTNKSGCLKLLPLQNAGSKKSDEIIIGEFNCVNATGKRLTAKKGTISAKHWYANVRIPDEAAKEKYKTVYAQAGYAIKNGQTITNRIIVIVPKGEKPKINCRMIYFPEL